MSAAAVAAGPRLPGRGGWSDRRAERLLGGVACLVLAVIAFMVVFVVAKALPSFAHNGLNWLSSPGDTPTNTEFDNILRPTTARVNYTLHAGPILGATAMVTGLSVVLALGFSVLASVFIVEFSPAWLRPTLGRVVRLLAAVPSVVYGLIGILVLVPFVGNHLITLHQKSSVNAVVQLTGACLLTGVVVLTVMIAPIMIAVISDALRQVPRSWSEGAAALGVNRWRVVRTIGLRAARPAIVAATVLATARALGEAIMLSMVAGRVGFQPNPLDGLIFFFEPARPLAATIIARNAVEPPALVSTLYGLAVILLISSFALSVGAYLAKQPMKRYGVRL